MNTATLPLRLKNSLQNFWPLCKPRVNSLIVFTAVIGMLLAVDNNPPILRILVASLGIALVAFSAAAINCLVERTIDAKMLRTAWRTKLQELSSPYEVMLLALLVGAIGLWILHFYINNLTMWLTLATFFGYAVVYTVLLKPNTPMNIVIGGASGAMPPVLGWAAMTGEIGMLPLALFLIVFLWTPPHFWSLACYRREDYAKSGLPMLPITHGIKFTCQHILLYTLMLSAASLIPISLGASGYFYLLTVSLLDLYFLYLAISLYQSYSDKLAHRLFIYSIAYLFALFAALFLDRLI